jgi:hypothetical protein
MNKMVTRGRLSIHLQEAPKLSKEWGEGQKAPEKKMGGRPIPGNPPLKNSLLDPFADAKPRLSIPMNR